ncbi:hypothetical protein HCC75_04570 [Levilactobacillus brevis]|uniref:hypothetical protein n=1 Tax=Levilactobacillus brevis TaxID=1580 RepID=UPI001142FA7C|nr:hypothetical protein [Levilactobacillus brevis]QOP52658.1 hypothetical protein HCC75_04570 [Levilactobacillus brevis]GEB75223.1 hypothetical protein LBR04_19620 [Levilactobacillus brevis]
MTATIQGKPVTGLVVGSDTFVPDSGWIPLALPDAVKDGAVFFKDNGDGTASLSGSVCVNDHGRANGYYPIVLPPKGYRFTDISSWKQASGSTRIYAYADHSTNGTDVSISSDAVKITDGVISRAFYSYAADTFYYIHFTTNGTLQGTASAAPATIGIEKI